MHIAYNGWFWNQPHTGSGQYIRNLLTALQKAAPDLQMTLVLPPGVIDADGLPTDVSVVTTDGGTGSLGKVWFEQRTYPNAVRQVEADIAHVPYWGPPLQSPARLVTSILDVIPLVIPEYIEGVGGRLYTALVSTAARGSAHVLTLSHSAAIDIEEQLGLPEASVTATYLAADDHFHPRMGAENDPAVREKYDLPERFVLYIGGFDLRKQVAQLLQAYTFVMEHGEDDVPLVMAGREPEWREPLFPNMRQYADELGISEHLQWIGYVDEADKPSLYRLADVTVYPSGYEGFGLPLLESMASGTPVVANEIATFSEIVGDGAFLVDPGNPEKMAGAIMALLGQPPLYQSMVSQGLAMATNYQWRKTAKATLDVYNQVMNMQG